MCCYKATNIQYHNGLRVRVMLLSATINNI